ncbi:MAG TPA: MFS transporter [Marmoricola sp.]|nr:MFS transporter [Marmoricola sp.]
MSATPAPSPPQETRFARVLVVVGIVALAFNLRPAAVSVGPVLDEIIAGLGMSAVEAGLLTSLPVLAFALFGALAPRLARLVGVHRLTTLALVGVVVGLWLRSRADDPLVFLALSLLALAGMATANVLLPSLVKLHFPDRIGLMTSVYSTALAIGLTSASVFTVPISEAYDGWRSGLAAWALLAAVAVIPWLGLLRHDRPADLETTEGRIGLGDVARTRLGWLMALFFGLQSLQAYAIFGWFAEVYRDAGFSAHTAGLLLGVITGISIPLSFAIPALAARMENQSPLMWGVMACYPVGYLGLILAPRQGAWLWALVVGVGICTFPLILTLIGLRARTAAGTAALSGFTQSTGYLISAVGPFGIGLLHDVTGGWTVPLIALIAVSVPQLMLGLAVSHPSYLEDELPSHGDTEPAVRRR